MLLVAAVVTFTAGCALAQTPVQRAFAAAADGKPIADRVFQDCPECPEMVAVPGGSFMMGAPAAEVQDFVFAEFEIPQKLQTVEPFAMSRTEITVEAWKAYVSETGAVFRNDSPKDSHCDWREPGYALSDALPVSCVRRADVEGFAAWLSRKAGVTYRLPTEAEWEYAARAGTTTAYWFGDAADETKAVFGPEREAPEAAASLEPNPFGLFDTVGNVSEWTSGCDPVYSRPPECTAISRGGSFRDEAMYVRAARRDLTPPNVRYNQLGFRLARSKP